MVILGIDPGYAIVGWGVIEYVHSHFRVINFGAITTPAGMPFEERLERIYDEMTLLLSRYHPDAMAVEQLFFSTNQKTGIDVAQARGVILLAAKKQTVPMFEYTPLQVKQSVVGYGQAVKKQVQEMTRMLLSLKAVPKPDDTADALAVAICHAHSSGSNASIGRLLGSTKGKSQKQVLADYYEKLYNEQQKKKRMNQNAVQSKRNPHP
ncbi:MAG TPA: crossover junction endodeoxyribonuclease RuvC [Firmicutes bacterium]|nr:crossover junction endodeoxyribonuclease RuvC [Bacillota bacterium]